MRPGGACFGHRVLPGALTGPAHDQRVAVPERERQAGSTTARAQKQGTR